MSTERTADRRNMGPGREINRVLGISACLFFLLTAIQNFAGYGQTLHATIRGRVTEKSGGVLPTVLVRAVNEDTNDSRQALSGPEGEYTLALLPVGTYRIEAEHIGFRKHVSRGIRLQVGQNLRANISLDPGGPADEVVVTAGPEMVEPDSTEMGSVIENRQIVNFPLDGRNFLQLSLLLPGSAPGAQGSPGSVRGEFSVNVSGAREDSNNFILDGAFNNDPKLNSFAINPPVDAIREFRIHTSTYDASLGRTAGAQINVALKSGTNNLHGTAYEFFRNGALDARNFFARGEDGKPRYQRNQFGFSLGGPVQKDSTFFFGDYEGRRERKGITQGARVPTNLERDGDFSGGQIIDPYTQLPFDQGKIDPSRISPIGRAIAHLYPMPNRADPKRNYVSSPILRDRDDRFDFRVDHSITKKSDLFLRYSFSDRNLYEPFSGPGFARIPGFGVNVLRRAQNLMIGETWTLSPNWINQAHFAFNRVSGGAYQENRNGGLNQSVGLPEVSSRLRDSGLSFISISGYSSIGDEYNNPQHSVTNVFQFADTLTYSRSKHLVQLGFEYRPLQQNAYRDVQSRGFITFSDFGQVTGNGLADLLLGFVTYSGIARMDNPQYLRARSWSFFVQDSYRMRPDLTVQLGLRYEYNSPAVDRYDRANTFDAFSKTLVQVGRGGTPRGAYNPDRNNWGPRVGIAWSPGNADRTVLRAGYGIFFDQASLAPGEGLYFNKPYYDFRMYFPFSGYPLTVYDPFPESYPMALPGSALGFDRSIRTPYVQQWNVALEHQFGPGNLVEMGYVGSKGTKILSARDINQPAPSPMQPNTRPLPQFADVTYLESRGNSTYHSLQARFQQNLRSGFSALAAYTVGKSLDENSTFFSSAGDSNFPQNSWNTSAEKGRSNFDIRHRLSIGYSYDLPLGLGRQFLSSGGFISRLLGGWTTYGIFTAQTGRPFTVILAPELDISNTGTASLGFGGANNRPNRIASGRIADPSPAMWFDRSAFQIADYGTFGNSGRNILEGPGYADWSVSLMKTSRVREGVDLQFRAEFFNALNHTNFDLPDNIMQIPTYQDGVLKDSSTLGTVNSARDPRRIQFGLKAIF